MPIPFKTILVPTDFSEDGDAAIPIAFRLAKDQGSFVILFHAVEGHETPNPLYAHYAPNPSPEEVEDQRQMTLAELRKRVPAWAGSIAWEARCAPGSASERILEIARNDQVSVIVIGSHGWGGLKHLFYGSVAKDILQEAPCPVLLYKA